MAASKLNCALAQSSAVANGDEKRAAAKNLSLQDAGMPPVAAHPARNTMHGLPDHIRYSSPSASCSSSSGNLAAVRAASNLSNSDHIVWSSSTSGSQISSSGNDSDEAADVGGQ